MENITDNTPISFLTVGEFNNLLRAYQPKKLIYGFEQLSEVLKLSKPTILKLVKNNEITFIRFGHRYIFDLDVILKERTVERINK